MMRNELIELASPPCRECSDPVRCVEQRWEYVGGDWRIGPTFLVCGNGHRVRVEPA